MYGIERKENFTGVSAMQTDVINHKAGHRVLQFFVAEFVRRDPQNVEAIHTEKSAWDFCWHFSYPSDSSSVIPKITPIAIATCVQTDIPPGGGVALAKRF